MSTKTQTFELEIFQGQRSLGIMALEAETYLAAREISAMFKYKLPAGEGWEMVLRGVTGKRVDFAENATGYHHPYNPHPVQAPPMGANGRPVASARSF